MKRLFGDDVDTVQVPGMEVDTISKYGINILLDFKPGEEPIRANAAEAMKRRNQGAPGTDTLSQCLPAGIPLATMLSEVTKVIQTPGLTLIMLELDSAVRQIYTDGRPHPVSRDPSWLGYSVGQWNKDMLVVDTVGFNDKTTLDIMGHPHSESMRLVERYRRRDAGHLDVEITLTIRSSTRNRSRSS